MKNPKKNPKKNISSPRNSGSQIWARPEIEDLGTITDITKYGLKYGCDYHARGPLHS